MTASLKNKLEVTFLLGFLALVLLSSLCYVFLYFKTELENQAACERWCYNTFQSSSTYLASKGCICDLSHKIVKGS